MVKYKETDPLHPFYEEGWGLGYSEGFDGEISGWEEEEEDRLQRESRQKNWTVEQLEAFEEGRQKGYDAGSFDV
jgi:hypothetical protein